MAGIQRRACQLALFPVTTINKANVNQFQVAWTYPFGDTGSHPVLVRGVVYGRGRNGSLVAVAK